MILNVKELPETADSHPFCSAGKRCGLDRSGYTEMEYLFSGTANIYKSNEKNEPEIRFRDCRYTNRMIVRKPKSAENFSGKVVVEIINSTADFDIERIWAESWRYLTRHGHIYVGITSKPNVFPALQRFDEIRYGELSWPNPSDEPDGYEEERMFPRIGDRSQEMGLIWDMLRDLPSLLKSNEEINPLAGLSVQKVFLTGWSQSCCYINRYLKSFVNTGLYPPLYDGFLKGGGMDELTPLNRYEAPRDENRTDCHIARYPRPFMEIKTESEATNEGMFLGYDMRKPDGNEPGYRYCFMEIAGGCHDALDTFVEYQDFDSDVAGAMGAPDTFRLGDGYQGINDYPKYFAFHIAFEKLFVWSDYGIAPKPVKRIEQSREGIAKKDAFGNSIGGLRTPLLDYPIARYTGCAFRKNPMSGREETDYLAGGVAYFSEQMITELYQDSGAYRQLVEKNVEELIYREMLLPEDAQDMVALAVERAVKHGLKEA